MEVIATENFDLAILDIMMEGYNGFELCSAIRDRNQTVPIILLSAKRDLIDKSLGFKLGADDYITKPFEPAELVMRVNSCLRRSQAFAEKSEGANGDGGSTIILGDLSIDTQTRQVTARGERLELTAKEYNILLLLAERPTSCSRVSKFSMRSGVTITTAAMGSSQSSYASFARRSRGILPNRFTLSPNGASATASCRIP